MSHRRVRVFARARPPRIEGSPSALRCGVDDSGATRIVEVSTQRRSSGHVDNSAVAHAFRYDGVFGPDAPQAAVYNDVCRPVVNEFLDGFNGTVFAYGQTGSGKTYTITGGSGYDARGLLPRAIQQVFEHCELNNHKVLSSVRVSYVEIYCEAVYDLLDTSHGEKGIEGWRKVSLREDVGGALVLGDLRVFEARTEADALNLLFLGNVNRVTAETPMNPVSSRSHCVFTMTLEQRDRESDVVRSSRLHLVDLAGSERTSSSSSSSISHLPSSASSVSPSSIGGRRLPRASSASEASSVASSVAPSVVGSVGSTSVATSVSRGSRRRSSSITRRASSRTRREARQINTSLHYLELVTLALAERDSARSRRARHIPYRNSVLTSFLRDSLGGNCATVFVATLNPEPDFAEESISTCRFAQRCAKLTSRVVRNEVQDLGIAVARLEREKAALQAKLERLRAHHSLQHPPHSITLSAASSPSSSSSHRPHAHGSSSTPPQLGEIAKAWLVPRALSDEDRKLCEEWVARFLRAATSVASVSWGEELDRVGHTVEERAVTKARLVAAATSPSPTPPHSHSASPTPLEDDRIHPDTEAWDKDEEESEGGGGEGRSRKGVDGGSDDVRSELRRRQLVSEAARDAAIASWPDFFVPWRDGTQAQLCAGLLREAVLAALKSQPEHVREEFFRSHTGISNSSGGGGEEDVERGGGKIKVETATALTSSSSSVRQDAPGEVTHDDVSDSVAQSSPTRTVGASSKLHGDDPGRALGIRSPSGTAVGRSGIGGVSESSFRRLLTSGAVFLKHGRHGSPHPRFVWCSADLRTIYWRAVGETAVRGALQASDVVQIRPGRTTPVFQRSSKAGREDASFSLITSSRTLDLEVELLGEPVAFGARPAEAKARDVWVRAFEFLLKLTEENKRRDQERQDAFTTPRIAPDDEASRSTDALATVVE